MKRKDSNERKRKNMLTKEEQIDAINEELEALDEVIAEIDREISGLKADSADLDPEDEDGDDEIGQRIIRAAESHRGQLARRRSALNAEKDELYEGAEA